MLTSPGAFRNLGAIEPGKHGPAGSRDHIHHNFEGTRGRPGTQAGLRPNTMKKILKQNRKAKITLSLPAKLIERLRNVVYWTPTLTLASLTESALESKLKKLEKGRRFRARKGKIRVGRPPKHGSAH